MSFTTDELYALLPAIYRIRDAAEGEPLRALIDVIAEQALVLEGDIDQLYENWFIETCDEWVVPYIGDLLGVRGLHVIEAGTAFSQRARVANTLRFRRRKGTATMLEQLARDTTGWNARAVEFFDLLGTTQYYNHIRPGNHRTADLRDTNRLELLDTPFDTIAHTADVRRIASGRGRHNIPNVGLFLWRLQSYFLPQSEVRAAPDGPVGAYRINALGLDAPLFNRPQTETEITHLAEEVNVPGMLRRRPLYDELEARRRALAEGRMPTAVYFGDGRDGVPPPVFELFLDGSDTPVAPEEVLICNLEAWAVPDNTKASTRPDASTVMLPITVAIDPVLGRLIFPASVTPSRVEASYAYGFPGDVGGGPYNRRVSLDAALPPTRPVTWHAGVSREATPVAGEPIFNTFADALAAWNARPSGAVGLITVMDNATYAEDLVAANRIQIPEGSLLVIAAADWPAVPVPGGASGQTQRLAGRVDPDERRPHLLGNLAIEGTAPAGSETPGELVIDGLLIEGAATVLAGHLGSVRLAHTTLGLHDPDNPVGLTVASSVNPDMQNPALRLVFDHCVSGPLVVPEAVLEVRVADSIVQAPRLNGTRGPALAAAGSTPGPATVIERSTILGSVHVEILSMASETLFTEIVEAERLQTGCVRFSFVPEGSRTPRRFRCQPTLALREHAEALGLSSVAALSPDEHDRIVRRLQPGFTTTRYGQPGFLQLSRSCAEEIRTGAEDGSEMGVWRFLKQPQRIANLDTSLDEFLRFGLEAGLLFVT